MKKSAFLIFTVILTSCLYPGQNLSADTIHLKNGGSIEGIIKSEDSNRIEINVGFGTITCSGNEVVSIDRSSPAELNSLTDKWEKKQEELKKREDDFAKERERRLAEREEWLNKEYEKKQQETKDTKEIHLVRDQGSRSISVSTLLNDKVSAMLVVDTGASIVVLARRVGEGLGVDLSDTKKDIVTMQLAGGRKVDAKMIVLKSVRIEDVEVKDVLAGILLEEAQGMGFRDGLLGMTFLSQFNVKIDLKNGKIVLEKLN